MFFSGIMNGILRVADAFLNLACGLLAQSFGLLFFVSGYLVGLLLHFAGCIFDSTFDLILVHGDSPVFLFCVVINIASTYLRGHADKKFRQRRVFGFVFYADYPLLSRRQEMHVTATSFFMKREMHACKKRSGAGGAAIRAAVAVVMAMVRTATSGCGIYPVFGGGGHRHAYPVLQPAWNLQYTSRT